MLAVPIQVEDVQAALQDKAAAEILQACIPEAQSAAGISAATGVPLVTVYRHLKNLTVANLIHVERAALTPTGKAYDLYRARLERASLEISEEGIEVLWRVREGMRDRLSDLWRKMEERK